MLVKLLDRKEEFYIKSREKPFFTKSSEHHGRQKNGLRDAHVLIPGTCEQTTLRDTQDYIKDLEMRLFWIIPVGPI